jgi:broad specificity phosphatase PhoE
LKKSATNPISQGFRRLILVRHGQASIESDHYDQLSSLGERQSRVLGEYWVGTGFVPDAVFCGPLARHRQTAEQVEDVFKNHGRPWPTTQVLPEFDEHAGMEVVKEALPLVAARDPEVASWARTMEEEPGQRVQFYFKIFRRLTRLWSRGALPGGSIHESWSAFRQRAAHGLERLATVDGQVSVVFTSAGSMAAAVAHGLELGDEKALELSWTVHNTGLSEFIERRGDLVLRTFNAIPHLADEELVTWV